MNAKNINKNCCGAAEGCCDTSDNGRDAYIGDCDSSDVIKTVKEYYGKKLHSKDDLLCGACCSVEKPSAEIIDVLPYIADEILSKFYGCGSPLPPLLEGMTVLDLGCGTGRDAYIASKLVGESGHVIGVDMTPEQIGVAKKYQEEQRERFGYRTSNVKFLQGYIEDLKSLRIEDNSVDVVISNCVINLSTSKKRVYDEIYRVMKPGGELFFSDIFSDRRIPESLANDSVLRGECLSGASYIEDFRRIMGSSGWTDFRYADIRAIDLGDGVIRDKLGFATFTSRTVRAFKLYDLEDISEDYGQIAYYNGGIPGRPHFYDLDDHHRFYMGKYTPVCGNTASMLSNTRLSKAFTVAGDRSVHFGVFGK